MWDKIKEYSSLIMTGLVAILGFLFVIERNKNRTLELQEHNKEVLKEVNDLQDKIDANEAKLETEEKYREEVQDALAKELQREPTDQEVTDFFNKRYNK